MYNLISTQIPISNNTDYISSSSLNNRFFMNKMQSSYKSVPNWSSSNTASITSNQIRANISPTGTATTINQENSDDHFNRHLENLVTNLTKELEEDEEHLDYEDDENVTKILNEDKKLNSNEDEDDQVNKDDEPKVFQVEDVDLPSLITSNLSNSVSASPNTTISLFNSSKTVIRLSLSNNGNINTPKDAKIIQQKKQNQLKITKNTKMNEIESNIINDSANKLALSNNDVLPNSTMPTPMLYISRSSSMTSLNSFDVKSVHSSIASEYSQATSPMSALQTKKKSNDEDEANHYSVDDDLDLIMPESPSAQHESSFLMTQRVKHKQQQIIYRQTAAAQMMPNNNDTNILPNNLFVNDQKATNYLQQMNKFISSSNSAKTVTHQIDSSQNAIHDLTINKPWKQCVNPPINLETNSKLSDLNQIMSRLNINTKNGLTDSSSISFLNTVTTSSTTVKSNNNIHTPPVKLVQTPKFISNFQQQQLSQFNPVPQVNNTQLPATTTVPMSVSYAFMKKTSNNVTTVPVVANTAISQTAVTQHPVTQINFANTNQFTANYQPKFLQSNQNYQIYNQPQQGSSLPAVLSSSLSSSSSSCSSSSQASVINQPQQQLSPTTDLPIDEPIEAPCIYAIETRFNHNNRQNRPNTNINPFLINTNLVDTTNNDHNRSCPLSPQESVCSRMSDTSVPSLIRQDISTRSNLFQSYLTNNQQQQIQQQSHTADFRELFSRLNCPNNMPKINNNNIKQQVPINFNSEYVEDDEKPKVFINYDEESTPSSNVPVCSNYNFNIPKINEMKTNQFMPQNRQFTTAITAVNAFPASFNKFNSNSIQQQYLCHSVNDSNLDTTYSPKVFQNEGTNSRYSSASSLNQEEEEEQDGNQSDNGFNRDIEDANVSAVNVYNKANNYLKAKQMNTPVCLINMANGNYMDDSNEQNNESNNDQEDDLLENFIKEMLPPVKNETNSKKIIQNSELSCSILSRQNNKHKSSNTDLSANSNSRTIKNQLSKSNSFKENKQICLSNINNKTLISNTVKKPINKRLSAENPITLSKPKTLVTKSANNATIIPHHQYQVQKPALSVNKAESVKSFSSSSSTPAPVVNMTKTAQLRAFNNKKVNSTNLNTSKVAAKPQTTKLKTKEILLKQSSHESNDFNSSLVIETELLNTRRQSFSFGCNKITTQKPTAIKTDTNSSRLIHPHRFNTKLNK